MSSLGSVQGPGAGAEPCAVDGVGATQQAAPAADAEPSAEAAGPSGWNASRMIGSSIASGLAQMARMLEAGGDLDAVAAGYGRGSLGTAEEQAKAEKAGEKFARKVADRAIDWSKPEVALNDISQIDRNIETFNDPVRCGAAAIVGGLVLKGPLAMAGAKAILENRLDVLEAKLEAAGKYTVEADGQLENTRGLLDELGPVAEEWTVGDVQKLQEALYVTALVDHQAFGGDAGYNEAAGLGLHASTVLAYRDLLWGATFEMTSFGIPLPTAPSYEIDGKHVPVDIVLRNDGHFVLATGKMHQADTDARVLYDPWPEGSGRGKGSAYSVAVDGGDVRLDSAKDQDVDAWKA